MSQKLYICPQNVLVLSSALPCMRTHRLLSSVFMLSICSCLVCPQHSVMRIFPSVPLPYSLIRYCTVNTLQTCALLLLVCNCLCRCMGKIKGVCRGRFIIPTHFATVYNVSSAPVLLLSDKWLKSISCNNEFLYRSFFFYVPVAMVSVLFTFP